jgi:hypothetical protein
LAVAVVAAALISSFLDPELSFDSASLATFLGFLVALVVILLSFEVPGLLEHRRVTGELGRLRVLPWALVLAAIFVLISRLTALQPGYLWGLVLGVVFMRSVDENVEGREQAAGALWVLIVSVVAWLLLGWVRSASGSDVTFLSRLAQTALGAVLVSGLEAVAIGLLPFRFMPGASVYLWSRPAWALLAGASIFGFIHILVGPTSGYLADLTSPAWIAAMGVFAAFGIVTVLFWGWFRLRPSPETEGEG